MSATRLLNCLIEGEDIVFPVTATCDDEVCHLKEHIQKKRELDSLMRVGPHTLELWRPKDSNPIAVKPRDTLIERIERMGDDLVDELKEPVDRVFSIFPTQPSREHIHIIVKTSCAANKKRNIMPTEYNFCYELIKVEGQLKLLQPTVEAFLKDPELPIWDPPEHCTSDIKEFIKGLQIPSYPNGKPSLLFHKLHECDGDSREITKIFGNNIHMCICNTSGSGKTRRMMEGLTKYWGFYLVAGSDVNGVGIQDLPEALDSVVNYREWVSDLRGISREKRAVQSDVNSRIACRAFRRVLAARLVVFELFLQLAKQVDGCLQEKHKRIWLLFQLFDSVNRRKTSLHPFVRIFKSLRHASDVALDILIDRFTDIYAKYIPGSRFILGVDEAQRAARLYPYSGISHTNPEAYQSIIRDMVKVFTGAPVKLVVSGTDLSLADLRDTMSSGVSKPVHGIEVFHQLGMFDTWPKLKCYVERYVPPSILQSHSGSAVQVRMREYLLGRYRFSVSFLEHFLMNGLQSPHKLLNKYLEAHMTCLPGDTGGAFTLGEPDLLTIVEVKGFEWDRLQLDSSAIQEAITIVQSHLTKGKSPTYGPVTAKLVEYGIAHLREAHQGYITEPLAFLSLMMWLKTHSNANLQLGASIQL